MSDDPFVSSPAAVQVLVQNHRRFLSFLERRVGSKAVAEEILQAAFVKGIAKGESIRADESSVAWFYRLLRNALTDHYRRRSAEERALERHASEVSADGTDAELEQVLCECLADVLQTLKPEYEQVLRRVDLEEGTVNSAADEIGITPNNAGVRLHRARLALRKQLERVCGSCTEHGCLDCSCQRSNPVKATGKPPHR